MDEQVLVLNADIHRLSSALLAQADDSWSDMQMQTLIIIQEASERLVVLVATPPYGDPDHWLHDLRSPGASMLSAISLLLDEIEYTPSSLDRTAAEKLYDQIVRLRSAVDAMFGQQEER